MRASAPEGGAGARLCRVRPRRRAGGRRDVVDYLPITVQRPLRVRTDEIPVIQHAGSSRTMAKKRGLKIIKSAHAQWLTPPPRKMPLDSIYAIICACGSSWWIRMSSWRHCLVQRGRLEKSSGDASWAHINLSWGSRFSWSTRPCSGASNCGRNAF